MKTYTQVESWLLATAIAVVAMLVVPVTVNAQLPAQRHVEVVLDLPYGSGSGSVGATKAGETGPGAPPKCPEMFQMTEDGTLWVLDTVNSRILAFSGGKQVMDLSTADLKKSPRLFGVTRNAIWVKNTVNVGSAPVFYLLRYDRETLECKAVNLRAADGTQFDPLRIIPLGTDETTLLINAVQSSDSSQTSIVLNQEGASAQSQPDGDSIPGADGSVWRLKPLDDARPADFPFTIDRYDIEKKTSQPMIQGVLPRRTALSQQRENALVRALGIDGSGRAVAVLYEGRPLSPRFFQIVASGEVLNAVTLEDLGFDSAPLGKYFATEHYQLLRDGSVLAQYATPDRYRIIRIYW